MRGCTLTYYNGCYGYDGYDRISCRKNCIFSVDGFDYMVRPGICHDIRVPVFATCSSYYDERYVGQVLPENRFGVISLWSTLCLAGIIGRAEEDYSRNVSGRVCDGVQGANLVSHVVFVFNSIVIFGYTTFSVVVAKTA